MSTFLLPREPFNAWSHGVGFLLAVVGTVYLWRRSRPYTPAIRFSLMVFGLGLIFCYAASTLFHGLRLSGHQIGPFDRIDRIGIFLLIAGTYTPLAWTQLKPRWRSSVLGIVWTISGLACLKLAVGGPFPPLWTTGLYLGMGWGIITCYAELSRVMTPPALRLLVRGGVLYTIGAVLNALHWPALWPGVFDAHGLFHLFVIAASTTHYRLMLEAVVPVPKPSPEAVAHRPRLSKPGTRTAVHR